MELSIVIHALKMWRNYLLSKRFIFMSDHNGIRYLFNQSSLNAWQSRWLATLNEFDFEIRCIDDILIYSKNKEEHAKHLAAVLRLLREHKLYAKLSKWSFFHIEVHYSGHVVSK